MNQRRGVKKSDVSKSLAKAWDKLGQGIPLDDLDVQRFAHSAAKAKAPKKPRQDLERAQVQRPLVVYLRRHLPAGSVVFAITNHARSRQQIFALMRDGMLPGVPDVCAVLPGGRVLFIECKRPDGGSRNDSQKHVQASLQAIGVAVMQECRSVEQAVEWLRAEGVAI